MRRLLVHLLVCSALLGGCRAERSKPADPASSPPRRIVTLAPNLAEIVFALGAGERLVGVSDYTDYPEQARAIPRIGGLEVDPEKVAALAPDLIIAVAEGTARGAVGSLSAAGLPVLVVPSGSLDAVLESIRLIGDRVGRAGEAKRLADSLARRRADVRARASGRKRPRALLLVWPDPPQAAGGGTFLDDVMTEAGADNVVRDRAGWPVLSKEWLATAPLDVVIVPESEPTREAYARAFAAGPLSRGPASRAKVLRLDESALTRPGPRVFDMLERLSAELP